MKGQWSLFLDIMGMPLATLHKPLIDDLRFSKTALQITILPPSHHPSSATVWQIDLSYPGEVGASMRVVVLCETTVSTVPTCKPGRTVRPPHLATEHRQDCISVCFYPDEAFKYLLSGSCSGARTTLSTKISPRQTGSSLSI